METKGVSSLKQLVGEYYIKIRNYYLNKKRIDEKYIQIRVESIDLLRGIAVIFSIFLICQGLEESVNPKHMISIWNGMAFADLILPFFILIMGMSIPFFVKKNHQNGKNVSEISRKVFKRSIALFVIGIIYSILFLPSNGAVRLTGPYQLLAINYVICTMVYLGFLKLKIKNNALTYVFIGIGTFVSVVFTAIAFKNGYSIEKSVFVTLDKLILKGFSSRSLANPEGILATFSAVSLTMYGLALGCILNKKPIEDKKYIKYKRKKMIKEQGWSFKNLGSDIKNWLNPKSIKSLLSNYYRLNNEAKKLINLILMGIGFYLMSKILGVWIPLNRNVFSITFVMRVSSYMFFIETLVYVLFDIIGFEFATYLIKRIGKNAIFVVLFISLFHRLLNLIKIKSIYTGAWMSFNNWFTNDFILPISGVDSASAIYGIAVTLIWVLIMNLLEKYEVKINI
ncbi:MAG: DUF5009 domain-containing protein [Peptostreptococcus sp.]|uniref:DUF5009 domain-containing protein n=1 Tax=Peptostreptococcus sp. TaxID=1262 RepID=UPI002FCA4D5A